MIKLLVAFFLLSASSAFAEDSNLFKLKEGSRISFNNITLNDNSSFKPFGPAYVVSESKTIFDRIFGGNREVADYKLCELSALNNANKGTTITPDMSFIVKGVRPGAQLTFYYLNQDRGPMQLRLICRQGVEQDIIFERLRILQ